MGIFGKLAFWKKKDDLGLDKDFGKDLGFDKDLGMDMGQGPSPDLGMGLEQQPLQKYPSFQQSSFQPNFPSQPSFQSQQSFQPSASNDSYIASKNLEVISSKLDALRASLDNVSQRLASIEAIARGEQEDNRRKRYY